MREYLKPCGGIANALLNLISRLALAAEFGEVGCQTAEKIKKTSMLNAQINVNVDITWNINHT